MSVQTPDEITARDLCVPIYLNERVVVDLLAILEDGFSQVSSVKESSTAREEHKLSAEGSAGLSRILKISLKGSADLERSTEGAKETTRERFHTPSSLLSKLLRAMRSRGLAKAVSWESLPDLKDGQFVEFDAQLKKNPLVDLLETLERFGDLAQSMGLGAKSKQKPGSDQAIEKIVMKQIGVLLEEFRKSKSIELVGVISGPPEIKTVLSAEPEFSDDSNGNNLIDGRFRVFAKVVRCLPKGHEDDASINLLRRTTFRHFNLNVEKVREGLEQIRELANLPEIITEIRGPAIQAIPIAIYA